MQVRSLRGPALWAGAVLNAAAAWGQNDNGAAGCAACGGCGGFFLLLWLAILAVNIAILVWVVRDAKARGMDSAVLWLLLVLLTGPLGLVIYLLSRPKGDLVACPNCSNKRLAASVKCPHCGAGS